MAQNDPRQGVVKTHRTMQEAFKDADYANWLYVDKPRTSVLQWLFKAAMVLAVVGSLFVFIS